MRHTVKTTHRGGHAWGGGMFQKTFSTLADVGVVTLHRQAMKDDLLLLAIQYSGDTNSMQTHCGAQ